MSSLVVAGSDGLESLLSSSIPNLKLANLLIYIDSSDLEIDADCWHEVFLELVILKAQKV